VGILGPDKPSTLTTRFCLAAEMAARGDHAAAEAEYLVILADCERVLGADHPLIDAVRAKVADSQDQHED